SRVAQFQLFHPPHRSPSWQGLPQKTQETTVRLLSRLLRGHWRRILASGKGKEARNEREDQAAAVGAHGDAVYSPGVSLQGQPQPGEAEVAVCHGGTFTAAGLA